jgi:hypothetical protein
MVILGEEEKEESLLSPTSSSQHCLYYFPSCTVTVIQPGTGPPVSSAVHPGGGGHPVHQSWPKVVLACPIVLGAEGSLCRLSICFWTTAK